MYYIQKDYITMNNNRQIKLRGNFTISFVTFNENDRYLIHI
ncbi:MAG: hypothetical protein K0S04_2632 [Herbinix sp.]|jgi:hypothetical protein|nr:hypothetical protein [Herbinix sp.]